MKNSELVIAAPCNADWSTMTLADRGRFCGACKKVVRELTQLTEREARALLAAPEAEGLCVRYVHDHTGEIVFKREMVPVSALTRMKRAAAVLAAASLPLGLTGCMGAAMPPPVMGAAAPEPPANTVALMGEPPAPPPETHAAARSGKVTKVGAQQWAIVPDDEPSTRICLDGPLAASAPKTEGNEVVFAGTPKATPPNARLACQPFTLTKLDPR
jgi:hypothetical protein